MSHSTSEESGSQYCEGQNLKSKCPQKEATLRVITHISSIFSDLRWHQDGSIKLNDMVLVEHPKY
jgi:hypothetical protein